ncbi:MFS general substrate transporter [Hyaloscypha hepaticicola]|uniref:MFS general substrate transporter n=1 Tax=Hyaloscypha hepaticicola TaxID=2082293 RepID=A0A2J6PVF6_9HELO|nr:MFS general substrate transporter [Hyaloscypha hepaticicola]
MQNDFIVDEEPPSADAEKGLASKELSEPYPGTVTPLSQSQTTTLVIQQSRHSHAKSVNLPLSFWKWATQKSNSLSDIDTNPTPDGGLTAWTVTIMAHMTAFNTFGFVNAYGVLQTYYVSRFGLPPSTVSWIGSVCAFLMFFTSTFSGRLTDAGYFHQTLLVGTFIQLLGFFSASFARNYWQILLSHGICIGLGGGLVFIPAMSLVGTYFTKRRSLALAISAIGNSFGGLIFSAILQSLLPKLGYGWTMRVCGFVVMGSMIPANFLLKPRRIKRTKAPLIDWSAFGEPIYACFATGMLFCMVGMWIPVFYLGSFGRDVIHVDTKDAASLLLIINGVGVLGRVIPAFVAARLSPLNLMIPLSLISGLILFCWAGVSTHTEIIVFDVFYGFIMAAAQGMLPPSLGSLTVDLSKMGVRMGMVFSICGFAVLVGNPLTGALITLDGGRYLYAQMFAGSAMTLGVLFLTAARVLKSGWSIHARL